jgi:predicted ATP-dependent protease
MSEYNIIHILPVRTVEGIGNVIFIELEKKRVLLKVLRRLRLWGLSPYHTALIL